MSLKGVGIAGCGRMGRPMLAALLRAGIDARGFDIRPPQEFGNLSAFMHKDADGFAKDLRHLITVVRDIPQTEDVLFGKQGFARRAQHIETIIISSTLSPRYVRDLRARVPQHIALVDAPMSGAAIRAERAELSFMLGGDQAVLDRMQPLFDAMGNSFHHMGDYGTGMSAKVLNNLLAASHTAMTRLVLDWADQSDIDEEKLLTLIDASSGQNWFASGFDDIEFARDGLGVENTIGILVKDVESAMDAAPEGSDISLPRAVQQAIAQLRPRAARSH